MLEKDYLSSSFGCFEITGSAMGITSVRRLEEEILPETTVAACKMAYNS